MVAQGPLTVFTTMEEYNNIDGIKYPVHTIFKDEDGSIFREIKLSEVEFNVESDIKIKKD